MIDTRRGFDAPVGISTGVLFPQREIRSDGRHDVTHDLTREVTHDLTHGVRQAPGPAQVGLFERPDWPQTVAYDPPRQQVIGFPDPHRPGQRQPRPEFHYEQPITPWYRAKRVWLAAALLLVAVALRFALSPEPAQLQSAEIQPAEVQSAQIEPAQIEPAQLQSAEIQPPEVTVDGDR